MQAIIQAGEAASGLDLGVDAPDLLMAGLPAAASGVATSVDPLLRTETTESNIVGPSGVIAIMKCEATENPHVTDNRALLAENERLRTQLRDNPLAADNRALLSENERLRAEVTTFGLQITRMEAQSVADISQVRISLFTSFNLLKP